MKAVKGATAEERAAARKVRTSQRRLTHFIDAIKEAKTGRQRLQQACQFAKAVGDDLDEQGRIEMAREVAEIADRRNRL